MGLALTTDRLVHNLGRSHQSRDYYALPKHLVDTADVYSNITLKMPGIVFKLLPLFTN